MGVFWGVASRICLRQHSAFLCSSYLDFSSCIWSVSFWCIHIIEWTQLRLWSLGLEKECLWLYSRCFQFPAEMPMYNLLPSVLCSMGNLNCTKISLTMTNPHLLTLGWADVWSTHFSRSSLFYSLFYSPEDSLIYIYIYIYCKPHLLISPLEACMSSEKEKVIFFVEINL